MASGPVPRPDVRPAPASTGQEQVLFLDRLAGVNAYNFQCVVRFSGELDVVLLEHALNTVVARHEVLRTELHENAGEIVQVVHPEYTHLLPVVDLTRLPEHRREEAAERLVHEEFRGSFDPGVLPLLRWKLLVLGPADHLLVHVEHHCVHDGWSLALLWQEIGEVYTAAKQGLAPRLPDLPVQYSDLAVWQRERRRGPDWARLAAFWRTGLSDPPPPLDLPFARPRPARQTFAGAAVRVRVPFGLYRELRRFARSEGVSLFMTMFAGFVALLHRHTGRTDLMVGTGVANRDHPATHAVIGMLVNTIVLRTRVHTGMSFRELLRQVRDVALAGYAHQNFPFSEVVRLAGARDPRYNPLVQVTFSFHDSAMPELAWPGVRGRLVERNNGTAKFDLNVIAFPRAEQRGTAAPDPERDWLDLNWEYNSDLFDEAAVTRLADQLTTLLSGAMADPAMPLDALPLDAGGPAHDRPEYPTDVCVHELFEAEAARVPDRDAVVSGAERLTYGELNRRANRLARRLRARGVAPETPVGVLLDRSVSFVVTALAVLKAGGAYVPVDPANPDERVAALLGRSGTAVVVTHDHLARRVPAGMTVVSPDDTPPGDDENPNVRVDPHGLAYVVFTSGSTGRPKGVLAPHLAVVRLVTAADYVRLGGDEVVSQLSSVSFDASTFEIWGALCNGARLVVGPPGPPSLDDIATLVREHGVTTLWLTTGLFHLLVDERAEELRGLRHLLTGGDVISPARVGAVLRAVPGCRLVNCYGPTENTTFTSAFPLPATWPPARQVPIGRPVAGTRMLVLDEELREVPDNTVGQLFVGGDGLARGYLGAPALTAERFVPDPWTPGARLYATGDLARRGPDGVIYFVGRLDAQVKIRGFRVEPGEVEESIRAHPGVRDVAVVPWGDSAENRRLIAYPVLGPALAGDPTAPRHLRGWLRQRLPDHLVPDLWQPVEELPLTTGGKVDRGALPVPAAIPPTAPAEPDELVAEERVLALIWADVLGVARVAAHDDFFDLGGHSLLATRMTARVRDAMGLDVPLSAVFDHPTLTELAEFVRAATRTTTPIATRS